MCDAVVAVDVVEIRTHTPPMTSFFSFPFFLCYGNLKLGQSYVSRPKQKACFPATRLLVGKIANCCIKVVCSFGDDAAKWVFIPVFIYIYIFLVDNNFSFNIEKNVIYLNEKHLFMIVEHLSTRFPKAHIIY